MTIKMQSSNAALVLLMNETLFPYRVTVFSDEVMRSTRVRAEHGGVLLDFSVSDFSRVGSDDAMLFQSGAEELRKVMRRELHETWGDYPEIRVWAAEHGVAEHHAKFGTLPGWVWSKWNSANPSRKCLKTGGVVTIGSEEDVATKKRTVIVEKGRLGNKKKAGAPTCPVHKTGLMKFNQIRNVFECQESGCKLIARPKTEEADGQVILGKGNVELRLVFTDPGTEPRVVLMSDNNVALDVTDYVDASILSTRFAVSEKIREAKQQGVVITRTPAASVPLTMGLAILGLENI